MKKLTLSLLITLSMLLAGCKTKVIDIPIDIPEGEEVELPTDTTPDETPETEEPATEPESEPEIQIITEYVDRYVEVPAEVERERKYEPGTYFASSEEVNENGGYTFVVVVIDAYGDIAGVHIDETYSSRILYRDEFENLYVFVEGDSITVPNSYRLIHKDLAYKNYPLISDAITTNDLIEGIHTDKITVLEEVQVNETKVFLNGDLKMGSTTLFNEQLSRVEQKIIEDNTTYGFNLYMSGDTLRTDSVAGVSIEVVEYLDLIQGILDDDASLKFDTELLSKDNPVYGVYTPGTYIAYSDRELENDDLNFAFSVTVIDDFGSIAGIYLDETFNNKIIDGTYSTKGIMGSYYGNKTSDEKYEWNEQASRFANQIMDNQGIEGIEVYSIDVLSEHVDTSIVSEGDLEYYTDQIAGVSVRVDRIAQAAKKTLDAAIFTEYIDGAYFTEGKDGLFGVINIKNGEIEDIYVDRLKTVFQAQYEFEEEEYGLYKFIRTFSLGDVLVSKSLNVYEKDGLYYSPIDLFEIQDVELESSQWLEKDREVELSAVEKAGLVVVPGNYTAKIAGDSKYVNLSGWKINNDKLVDVFVEENGTHTIFLENGEYIISEDILYYDVSAVLELVNNGLYQARLGNPTFEGVGTTNTNILADGDFFYSTDPNTNGEIEFGYMTVTDGNITSLYFDRTYLSDQGTTTLFVENQFGTFRNQMVDFVDVIISNQNYLVNKMTDNYVYYEENSIQHIQNDEIFASTSTNFEVDTFVAIFEELVDLSVNERLITDAKYIAYYLENSEDYYKDWYFLTYQNLENFLPREFAIRELANEYELEWISSNDRDLDLDNPADGYDVEVDNRIDEDTTVDLTMIVRLPYTDEIIYEHVFTFEILTRSSEGTRLLSSTNLSLPSKYILENTIVDMPTNDTGMIKWESSDETVMSNTGHVYGVSADTIVTLTAYADIDENGKLSTGEPTKQFSVNILTTENAIKRVRDSIELATIYQYIDRDFVLSNRSPVWGVTYQWNAFNPYIVLTEYDGYTNVRVIRTTYDANVTFTADINVGSVNNDVTQNFKILEGSKETFEQYSNEDLNAITFDHNLKKLIVGDDLRFDEQLFGLIRNTSMSFEINDFEMFVDSDGNVIANHPTKNAEFTLTATSKVFGQNEVFTKEWDICILSDATIYNYVLKDKDILSDYTIDLSHNLYLDVEIELPTEGFVHDSEITWEILAGETVDPGKIDTTRLDEGIITILTKTGTDTVRTEDSFTLLANISLGDKVATKEIEILLKD